MEARTSKSRPRNFSIVLAFAGDSTITSFFAIPFTLMFILEGRLINPAARGDALEILRTYARAISLHRIAYPDKWFSYFNIRIRCLRKDNIRCLVYIPFRVDVIFRTEQRSIVVAGLAPAMPNNTHPLHLTGLAIACSSYT